MKWYKIVEKDSDGNYRTLFHGINRSRKLPVGKWIKSDQKIVSDGSSGTKYISGWHVMDDHDACKKYLERFTAARELVIVECKIKGDYWEKSHSRDEVYLSEYIKIIGEV